MSDKDPKQTEAGMGLSSSQSQSSSEQLPPQASLEKWLGEVVVGLRGVSAAVMKLHGGLYLEILPLLQDRDSTIVETHRLIGAARLESANLAEEVHGLTEAAKQLIVVVIDSRKSVDGAREDLDETAAKLEKFAKDISGEHPTMGPEDAPSMVHVIVRAATNFTWKYRKAVTRTIAVGVAGIWTWAGPHVYAAIKLFWSAQ